MVNLIYVVVGMWLLLVDFEINGGLLCVSCVKEVGWL